MGRNYLHNIKQDNIPLAVFSHAHRSAASPPPLHHPLPSRPLNELHEVADGKRMYSNYRMDIIDKVLGPSVAAPVAVQVRGACRGGAVQHTRVCGSLVCVMDVA